ITSTQEIYIICQTGTVPNCISETSFTVTINPTPAVPTVADVTVCDSYTLPALAARQSYHSAPGGDSATLIPVGTNITTTQTIYVFAQTGTVPNCSSEASFTVTVNPTPVPDAPADVVACDSYILPALSVGDYYSGPGASGTAYFAGDEITAGMTMYVYAETGTTPNCWAENSFEIGIFFSPVIGAPTPYPLCDDNNDGFSCFDLHSKDAEITGGAPNLVVTYHETQT